MMTPLLSELRANLGSDHYGVGEAHGVLAMALALMGERERALGEFREAPGSFSVDRAAMVRGQSTPCVNSRAGTFWRPILLSFPSLQEANAPDGSRSRG